MGRGHESRAAVRTGCGPHRGRSRPRDVCVAARTRGCLPAPSRSDASVHWRGQNPGPRPKVPVGPSGAGSPWGTASLQTAGGAGASLSCSCQGPHRPGRAATHCPLQAKPRGTAKDTPVCGLCSQRGPGLAGLGRDNPVSGCARDATASGPSVGTWVKHLASLFPRASADKSHRLASPTVGVKCFVNGRRCASLGDRFMNHR